MVRVDLLLRGQMDQIYSLPPNVGHHHHLDSSTIPSRSTYNAISQPLPNSPQSSRHQPSTRTGQISPQTQTQTQVQTSPSPATRPPSSPEIHLSLGLPRASHSPTFIPLRHRTPSPNPLQKVPSLPPSPPTQNLQTARLSLVIPPPNV
jgi:hypothetical protein